MVNYNELKEKIEDVLDPYYKRPLRDVNGIRKLVIGPTGIVDLEIQIKDRLVNEVKIKPLLLMLIKQDLGFPGVKLEFYESNYLPEGQKEIIYLAVASGKGGVGKSSVSANLAKALLRNGFRAGIIDADIYGASIPQILNVPQKQVETDENEAMIPLSGEGIEVMSVYFFMGDKPLLWRGPMLGKMLDHFFHGVKWSSDTEVVIIDLPPGTGDVTIDVQRMLPQAKVLIITTPHINASTVAYKAGTGSIELGHEVIGVVENMSYYINSVSKQREYIFGEGGGLIVASKLHTDLLAQIPISSPHEYGKFTYEHDEEMGAIYDRLAKKIIGKLNLS